MFAAGAAAAGVAAAGVATATVDGAAAARAVPPLLDSPSFAAPLRAAAAIGPMPQHSV